MKELNALSRLQDEELCIITTKAGEHEVRWSVANWCAFSIWTVVRRSFAPPKKLRNGGRRQFRSVDTTCYWSLTHLLVE